jgi:hypothetical protein
MLTSIIRALSARPRTRATEILAEYRAAVDAGDYGAAVRRKLEFARFRAGVRRAAMAAVYADVLPSHRARYAFRGERALVATPPQTAPGM